MSPHEEADGAAGAPSTPEAYFAGHPIALAVFHRVRDLVDALGPADVPVSKSQVAFRRRRGFAYVWLPGRYLARPQADVVVSFALGRHDDSPRFKQVVQVSPHHWMHHLELHEPAEVDAEVGAWLREAWERAG